MSRNFNIPVVGGSASSKMVERIRGGTTGHSPAWSFWWRQVIDFGENPGFVGEVALNSVLDQTIDLNTAFPDNAFPGTSAGVEGVLKGSAVWRLDVGADGVGMAVNSANFSLGDGANDEVWIQPSDIHADTAALGFSSTPNALEHRPDVRGNNVTVSMAIVTAAGNVDELTVGRFEIFVQFFPLPLD